MATEGGVFANVDGEWRRAKTSYMNVNGVWRKATPRPYVDINGVWRTTRPREYKDGTYEEEDSTDIITDDIVGFRIIYTIKKDAVYEDLPDLTYNPDLPCTFALSGDTSGEMNMEYKGVVFQYNTLYEPDQWFNQDDQEGIMMYEGRLYGVTTDGYLIDITSVKDILYWENRITDTGISDGTEAWSMDGSNALNIEIQMRVTYETNGLNTEGWNKMFTTTNYIGALSVDDDSDTNYERLNDVIISPIDARSDIFYPCAEIGIARDLHTVGRNMVGSYGTLDHTYNWIKLNGEKKPFVCEIYN